MELKGIDVSHYQGDVDWFAVAGHGISFAFAKATEGTTSVDDRFERNWKGIQGAGLFRGAYHFGRPGRDPDVQAVHFASVVGTLGFRDLPPVLDLEEDDGRDAEAVIRWARAFVERTEALLARRILVYTGGFWRSQLRNRVDPFFSARPLWLAAYTSKIPIVPASWSDWTFWQYTDGRFGAPPPVQGVRGPVDQNRFRGDEAALNQFCEGATLGAEAPSQDVPAPRPGSTWPGVHFVFPHSPPVAGEDVKRWQVQMTRRGFAIDTDGVYGPESKNACRAFQRNEGLVSDGIVGPRTWDLCFAET